MGKVRATKELSKMERGRKTERNQGRPTKRVKKKVKMEVKIQTKEKS